jgi:hypothetical protein
MRLPVSTYKEMLLKISDPDAPLREQRKLLARRLTGASKRGAVAEDQISWLRYKAGEVAQNPPNQRIAKDLEICTCHFWPLLVTQTKGRRVGR